MIAEMNKVIEEMRPYFKAVNWEDDHAYALWLSQAYYIARRSTSFLGLCLFHSDKYPGFQKRCTEHIAEETGHEKLIENDLKQLKIQLQPELPSTMAIYQTQYFRIVAENPLSFVGYIFLLELLAPAYGQYIMDRASNKRALSFLKVHTSADEDHIGQAMKILETLSEDEKKMALTNFLMTAESYKQMLETVAAMSLKMQESA